MANLLINGRNIQAPLGTSLLEVLRAEGLDVPTLCQDDRLEPASACRLCEVEVAGSERPLCACATVVAEGMSVLTHTPALEDYRRSVLEMLARHYPPEAVTQDPDRPFHRLLDRYGVQAKGTVDPAKIDPAHPYLRLDMNRCVDCYRCVRICAEVQGQFVWKVVDRGGRTHVAPGEASRLQESPCVSCGACADTCPTGAIEAQTRHETEGSLIWTRTICPYCGTGCELEVGARGTHLVEARPTLDSPVNRGHLCVKGRFGLGFGEAEDRVLHPMVRRDGAWVRVSWEEALDEAAALLAGIRETHGPQAIGVLGSSRGTNEEAFLTQKLARVALGTGNVDCCARVCHAPSAAGLGLVLGTGAATNSFADIERAALIMVVGANPTENHPIVGNRIKQRALAGVPLIVIDPRRTELAALATVHLAPEPGTNLPLLQAMAHVILSEELEDPAFLEKRVDGLAAFAASVKAWTPERAGALCGIHPDAIRRAARLYATIRPGYLCNGLGVTEQIQGTDSIMALANLALLTGNLGVPGGGVNPLRGQNNVQGCAQMGCEPKRLTGYQPFEAAKERHEALWGPLPGPGLDVLEMLDAAREGELKALLIFGYDLYLSNPDAHTTARALAELEGLIAIDPFLTETAQAFATVFLPAATPLEKDGTFMNGERRVQRIRKALPPPGEARTDLDILCALAARLGFAPAFTYPNPEAVWNEVRTLWSAVAGISYPRVEHRGLQWPCPTEDHPGTEILHGETFPVGQRATLRVLDWIPSAQHRGDGFPFLLNTGRSLYHFNAGTMTGRTRNAELEPDDLLEIHPRDARVLGLKDGDRVQVESHFGSFEAQARVTDRVRSGEPFATFHTPKLNRATGPGRDARTHTPEYKRTAVRILPLQEG